MTQKSQILSFLLKNTPKQFTSKQITKKLQFPNVSIRGRLSELKKENKIRSTIIRVGILRRKKTVYFIDDIIKFRRKIAKGVQYCENKGSLHKGTKENIFAITYESNRIDRFDELVIEIENSSLAINCHIMDEFGYDDQKLVFNPPFIYPEIRVDAEI